MEDKIKILEKFVQNFEEYASLHPEDCMLWSENSDDQDEYGRICTCGLTEAAIDSFKLILTNFVEKERLEDMITEVIRDTFRFLRSIAADQPHIGDDELLAPWRENAQTDYLKSKLLTPEGD